MKKRLIPTPLVPPSAMTPVKILSGPDRKPAGSLLLFSRLIMFGLSLAWAIQFQKLSPSKTAVRVREFLESLGGMWIKAGQLISLRTDILSSAMAEQLSLLQYQSYGFEPAVARRVLETGIGQPIEQVFDEFEDAPFAAASISQIHKARLRKNGKIVAVKVQRPNIARLLERDMRLIAWLLRRLASVPGVGYIDFEGMIRELDRMLNEEVDYSFEIANLRRMRKVLKAHEVVTPKIYSKLSTPNIIVMEYLPGVVMSDYIRIKRNDTRLVDAWLRENNIDPIKVGSRIMRSFYRQMFEDNVFHGDLHPGNIMLLRDSRFALIDFGTIGTLETRFVQLYKQQAAAFVQRDWNRAADAYLMLADSIPLMDVNAYRTEFTEAAREWEARTHLRSQTFLERSITGGLAIKLGDVNKKYQVNISWQFLRVGRSISTMDANLSNLLRHKNPNKILEKYLQESIRRGLKRIGQNAVETIARVVSDADDVLTIGGASLRRGAIAMGAMRSKASQVLELVASVLRAGVVIGGIALLYDFLFNHAHSWVAAIDRHSGAIGDLAEAIPDYAPELGVPVFLGVFVLCYIFHRIKLVFAQEPIRSPKGEVER